MYPLFVLGLLFLVAFFIQVMRINDSNDQAFARIVIPVAWVAFIIDYLIRLALAPHKWHYVRSNPLMLVALIFPPFRIFIVFHVFAVISKNTPIGSRSRTYLLFITTLTAFVGALLVVYFERQSPEANITSFGNALWWVGETVSTVGYGDYYPVTVGGRIVAVLLFINGVALVSVLTAGLAQSYTSSEAKRASAEAAAASAETEAAQSAGAAASSTATGSAPAEGSGEHVLVPKETLENLHQRLSSIEADLQAITSHLGTRPKSNPDPAPDTPAG